MTLLDLITLFRHEADDATEPYLWSDDELTDFANDAEDEACRRARLLVDSSSALCSAAATAADSLVTLDPRVLFVRRIQLAGSGARPLLRITLRDLDAMQPAWLTSLGKGPRMFVTDYQSGALLLFPWLAADTTVQMTLVRTPLAPMTDLQDSPEIAPRWQRSLRYWMLYRAYSKQDAQANDPKKAADSLALFEQEFGKKSSAIDETWIAHEQIDYDGSF